MGEGWPPGPVACEGCRAVLCRLLCPPGPNRVEFGGFDNDPLATFD